MWTDESDQGQFVGPDPVGALFGWSVATAAGIPPMSTVGSPGPMMVPPWVVVSVTRAAAGTPGAW